MAVAAPGRRVTDQSWRTALIIQRPHTPSLRDEHAREYAAAGCPRLRQPWLDDTGRSRPYSALLRKLEERLLRGAVLERHRELSAGARPGLVGLPDVDE